MLSAMIGAALISFGLPAPQQQQSPARAAAPAYGGEERQLNGVGHWYKLAGKPAPGVPPLVYLAGGPGGNSYDFERLVGHKLEPSLQLVYFDQRGTGRSERPASGDYALSTLVEDLEALRVALGVPQIAIATHSFGTVIGLEYAAKYPQHVHSMVLTGALWSTSVACRETVTRLEKAEPAAFAAAFPEGAAKVPDGELCRKAFLAVPPARREAFNRSNMFPDPAAYDRIQAVRAEVPLKNTGELSAYQFKHGLLGYNFDRFDRLTMPVLVVGGEHDWAVGPRTQRQLAERLPRGRFIEYKNAGHWMFVDQPDHFARDVVQFLKGAAK